MKAVQLLRDQNKWAHDLLEATLKDVAKDVAHFRKVGNALPIGAAYAHAILSEDMIVATMFLQTKPLSAKTKNIGVSKPMPGFDKWDQHAQWVKTVEVDLKKLAAFFKKVAKVTDKWLATLTDKDLDREIDRPVVGKHSLGFFISNFVILHTANLTGEVSAIKGVQGLKGYPF